MRATHSLTVICTLAAASLALTAAETANNLLTNGDFEAKPRVVAKSSNSYIFARVQDGWDFGEGPFATLAPGWTPNGGTATLRVVDAPVSDVPENHALMLSTADQGCHIYAQTTAAGSHTISFDARGKGSVAYCIYCYRIDGSGKQEMLKTLLVLRADLGDDWATYRLTFDTRELLPAADVFTSAFGISANTEVYLDNVTLVESAAATESDR